MIAYAAFIFCSQSGATCIFSTKTPQKSDAAPGKPPPKYWKSRDLTGNHSDRDTPIHSNDSINTTVFQLLSHYLFICHVPSTLFETGFCTSRQNSFFGIWRQNFVLCKSFDRYFLFPFFKDISLPSFLRTWTFCIYSFMPFFSILLTTIFKLQICTPIHANTFSKQRNTHSIQA